MATLGERIKSLRQESGLTQEEFGKKFGVAKSTVSLYESGRSTPDDTMKLKIADHYDVSVDYLLGLTNDRKRYYYQLTDKDNKEIDNYIYNMEVGLSAGLLLDGEPIDEEALATLRENIRFAAEIAKREAKRKHTPKKYRD